MDLYLRKLSYCFQLTRNHVLYTRAFNTLSSDVMLYHDTFDMMHQYSWSLYPLISNSYTSLILTTIQLY